MAKTAAQLDREISHALVKGPGKRWVHRTVAQRYGVPEDVVRRIYAAVQTAKKQGLRGGYAVDLIERMVGRRLINGEYNVQKRAREHLQYNPEGGYQGPEPQGEAAEPMRVHDEKKALTARQLAERAERTITDVMKRLGHLDLWDERRDSALLQQAAGELDAAADAFEEAGPRFNVHAGTLRKRAELARSGHYRKLLTYTS
jgi:hypothetical protein